ncbi:hypothetical protein B0T26DRAFT_696366 [Lasiosphaeria miniovina]|uniref:Uncharacterized protein n=1 Tax=Lasiosphaeria miniovina TaxID=1954250 RepID=A0AA40E8K7_9PEZI|nr:uncharacterized protein B0T26DRAFT_696366 [Lasiosphaeria miniovina]KAK0728001.1 hypothetical protein B0T26DRAFT_696366 [Lasiosphaeria miniovina]
MHPRVVHSVRSGLMSGPIVVPGRLPPFPFLSLAMILLLPYLTPVTMATVAGAALYFAGWFWDFIPITDEQSLPLPIRVVVASHIGCWFDRKF